MIMALSNANVHAAEGDVNRNHVNYGEAIQAAKTLRKMGQAAEIAAYKDDEGFLIIEKLTVNGKETEFSYVRQGLQGTRKGGA
jgi:hypothetical protein